MMKSTTTKNATIGAGARSEMGSQAYTAKATTLATTQKPEKISTIALGCDRRRIQPLAAALTKASGKNTT